jgi:predicted dehydrogenase
MSSKTFNVAVIGYGLSAKVFHIPLILAVPAFRLYGIVQRHPTITDDAEKDHPGVRRYGSAEEMVEDKGVDLVVVTTIPDTHVQLTTLALQAGKNGMLL